MIDLAQSQLEEFRDQLQARGQRPSMVTPGASLDLIEAMHVVEEYGPMCEAMYLIMAADRRVLNVEREVLRGALDVLSDGRVRTAHMEAMIDSSSRRVTRMGEMGCLEACIEALKDDPIRAETTVLCAAAVAAADNRVTPEERALFEKLVEGLEMSQERASELLDGLVAQVAAKSKR